MRWIEPVFAMILIPGLLVSGAVRADLACGSSCAGCYEKLETFRGREVKVQQLDPSRFAHGEVRLGDLFGDPKSELIVGWSGPAHAYVMTANARFDGEMFFAGGRANLGDNSIDPGVFFRFKGLPQETVDQVRSEIRRIFERQIDGRPPASATCVAGACKVLKAGGIQVAGPFGDDVLATRTFTRMIKNGFVDSSGKPVQVEIYRTHPRSLDNLQAKMKDFENDQLKRLSTPFIALATTGAASGFWLYVVIGELTGGFGAE